MITISIIIVLLILFGFILVNYLYKQTNAYSNQILPAKKYKHGVPYNLEIVNFGSTYTMFAFNSYKDLQLNGFSFAMDAQSLEIDNVLLHKYADHIKEGATVIFGLAACVSFYRYSMTSNKGLYYTFMKRCDIPAYNILEALNYYFPIRLGTLKRIKSLVKDADEYSDVIEKFPPTCSDAMAVSNMKAMAAGWCRMFRLKNLKEFSNDGVNMVNQEYNANLLKSMVLFCKEHKWKPVFVITPFSAELNQYFSDEFVNSALYKMMEPSVQEYKVPIYDYRKCESFQHDKASFLDGGFRLSKFGSRKFMRHLLNDLAKESNNYE